MSEHERAANSFCKWAEDIGFIDKPSADPEESPQVDENKPAPLGIAGQNGRTEIRDQFADYMEDTINFH